MMMKQSAICRILILICVLLLCYPASIAQAADLPVAQGTPVQTVRVLLGRLGITDRLDMTLGGAYTARAMETTLAFERGSEIAVLLKNGSMYLHYLGLTMDAGTELVLKRHLDAAGTAENGLRFANNPAFYEGDLRLTVVEDKIRLILSIGVEDYLKGVVPYEMSETFPLEALKAQAVAARTYAVSKAVANAGKEYDLVDNTNDQVYKGSRAEYVQANRAVAETSGICGFYKNKLAICYYSASNGGQTELATNVWGTSEDYGYLDMRDDPYDLENPQSKVQSVTLPKAAATVEEAPYVLRLLLSQELAKTLTAAGYDATPESMRVDQVVSVSVDTPKLAAPSRVYSMLHITFGYSARTRTDAAVTPNNVAQVATVAEDDEEVSLFTPEPTAETTPRPTDAAIAAAAQTTLPPAPTPTPAPSYGPFVAAEKLVTLSIPIFPNAEKALSLGINYYDNEMITVRETDTTFVIESRRFGHGVGMSQRGAEWMAGAHSKTYTEILAFYYPGVTLMRYPEPSMPIPTLAPPLGETAGPAPTPTPRPTLMPVSMALPEGAWYATVTGIDDDSSLNLRAAPDIAGDILTRLYKNQQLIVLEECPQEDWLRVRTDVIEGFVMEKFLTQER